MTAGVVYVIEVADRPGIVHSIAAVFAHRGLSMRALVADTGRQPSRILVVFGGTARQARLVERVLVRLHHVLSVRVLPTDSPQLRAIAVCRVAAAALPPLPEVDVQALGDTSLLSGSYAAVDAAIDTLTRSGAVQEVSRSLVAL